MIFPLLLICAAVLCGCDAREMGTLSDFSKPYAGMYECTELTLGGESALEKFEFVRLELRGDDTFSLTYRTAEGNEGGTDGEYRMDEARGELTLSKKTMLRTVSHVFSVESGTIYGDLNFNGALLHVAFSQP